MGLVLVHVRNRAAQLEQRGRVFGAFDEIYLVGGLWRTSMHPERGRRALCMPPCRRLSARPSTRPTGCCARNINNRNC